jgi:hypothetical protein
MHALRCLRVVLTIAVLTVFGASPAPVPQTGGVYVATLPDAADVWLDGAYVGRSPVLLDGLTPGKHTVTVSRFGWDSEDTPIDIVTGNLAGTLLQLQRSTNSRSDTGRLQLHGATPTSVTVDGNAVKLDAHGGAIVAAGTHTLVVHSAHDRYDRAVRIYPDMTTDVVLAGAPAATAEAKSSVVAPAEDYLPASAFHVTGTRVVVRYKAHLVTARVGDSAYVMDGKTVSFDSAPVVLHEKLYLPLALLVEVTGAKE